MARTVYAPREEYVGTGLLTEYTFDFKITALEDLRIVQVTSALVAVFDVDGNDATYLDSVVFDETEGGGTITLTDALPSGSHLIVLMADNDPLQESEFRDRGAFTLRRIENALDVLSGQIQTLFYKMKRVPQIPTSVLDAVAFEGEAVTAATIADKIFAVNSDGDGIEMIDNPEDLTMAAIGAVPNGDGATFVSNVLTLMPASSTYGGVLTAIAQAIGGVKTFVDHLIRGAASGITAYAGGGQANATVLAKWVNRITTCASSGDSVKLPAAVAGMEVIVVNDGAATLNIYPATGETIDGAAANAPYGLSTSVNITRFVCAATGAWLAGSATVVGGGTLTVTGTAASPTLVTAIGGIAFAGSDMLNTAYIGGNGGAVTVTANPQIAAGTILGQRLRTIVPAGANQITLANGTGLLTDGASALIMAAGSMADWEWNGSAWFETGRITA